MLLSTWRALRQPRWRMLVLLTGILILFTWRCWFLYQKAQIPYLLVPVHSSLTGQAQLHYDRGYGLNEHDSVLRNVEKNRQKLWGVIPWPGSWVGSQGQFYLFQLPLSPVRAFILESRGNSGTMRIEDAVIVNGLGNFIRAVADKEKSNLRAGIVFNPPLLLDQYRFFRATDFCIRGMAEFLVLFAVVISLYKFNNFLISSSFVRSAGKKISCLKNPVVQNKLALIFFTIIFLWFYRPLAEHWFPLFFKKSLFCIFILLTIRHFFIRHDKSNIWYLSLLFFSLLSIISALMHFFSLSFVDVNNHISINYYYYNAILFNKYEWINRLTGETSEYLFFIPLLFISSLSFFSNINNAWKTLLWIPVIYLPCLIVALYQVHIDSTFLNNSSADYFVNGLSGSFISFRIILFLIFPLYVFAVLIANKWWKRVLFILPAIVMLWLARLSYGRASIFGFIGFILSLPIILIWVGWARKKALNYIYAGFVCLLGLVILTGIMIPEFHDKMSQVLTAKLVRSTYALLKGQSYVDPRHEYYTQALRIIRSAPVAGWGPAAFIKNVERTRYIHGDKLKSDHMYVMPSLYLELLANYGIIGAATGILALFLIPLLMIFRVRKQIQEREERLAVGIIFTVVCIMVMLFNTHPLISYMDIHWIYAIYVGFLVSVALKYNNQLFQIKRRTWMWVLLIGPILTIIFIGGTYQTTFGSYGYKMIQQKILSLVSDGYVPGTQTIILNNKELIQPIDMSNTLIATRGNPFRMKYTTNLFHMQARSIPYRVGSRDSFVCIKTSVRKRGNRDSFRESFTLKVRVFLNNVGLEHHYFNTDGDKKLFYQLDQFDKHIGHINQEPEIKVTLDLWKKIPYHEDDRAEIELANYMPSHKDYEDLDIIISVVPYSLRVADER